MGRALGVTDNVPVERIDWHLEVDADAPREQLEELKLIADEHCSGRYDQLPLERTANAGETDAELAFRRLPERAKCVRSRVASSPPVRVCVLAFAG